MKKDITIQEQTMNLRQRAKAKIDNENPFVNEEMQTAEEQALLHELLVHQLELEMQNEELKNANAQTEIALSKYYDLYHLAPIGYFTINGQGKILESNHAGSELLEVKNCYLLNNYFQNFIAQECLSLFDTFRMRILESPKKQDCKISLLKKGKTRFQAQITGIAINSHNESENQLWLSVLDITDQVIAEEAKEEVRRIHEDENNRLIEQIRMFDRLKTEYFSNLSHELRTPLNVILSSLKLLEFKKSTLHAEDPLKMDKHISTIKQNSFRLLRLVNNIIDMTKIESGFFEINLKNCNIVSIVEEITLSIAEYVENKGIVLLFDTDVEEKLISCDLDKIERIMLNLLSNSIKFTKSGGSINVNVFEREEEVEIAVSDTGIGIPKEKQELIFQRFRQVESSMVKEQEGSGIGLSLVKSLVEMQGGTISFESEYGKGSTFVIKLPAKILDWEEAVPINIDDHRKQTQIERLNIEFSDIYS